MTPELATAAVQITTQAHGWPETCALIASFAIFGLVAWASFKAVNRPVMKYNFHVDTLEFMREIQKLAERVDRLEGKK